VRPPRGCRGVKTWLPSLGGIQFPESRKTKRGQAEGKKQPGGRRYGTSNWKMGSLKEATSPLVENQATKELGEGGGKSVVW